MQTEEFVLSGLRCPSCARLIQEDASKLDGVESAEVDLAARTLRLLYDEQTFQFAKLEAAIKAAGFGVSRA
jgi:copper chaperone/Cu+-exporting ATPase